ncbi:glycosyltransferase family 4 protein [Daejeonella sp. JGW-45]|uniref:glycosyltransferase family 4 protein n=1 Tax=Daejeonella sp. JGW-45 TaxID=3034148 RepID=UPI0023EBE6C5|nr:glycosyltransferase family 4 protein [Daejeonella sp. JGW-45]
MKKVILNIYSLRNGGAERVMANLANHLTVRGYEVYIITIGNAESGYELSSDIKIIELGFDSLNSGLVASIKKFLKTVKAIHKNFVIIKPDLCISFMTETNIISLIAGKLCHVPVIVSERTNPLKHSISSVYSFLRKSLYKYATEVVLQTEGVLAFYRKNLKIKNLQVIPNPILIRDFMPCEEIKKKTILSVGRLSQEKGHLLLINAFAKSDAVKLGWKLIIVGSGPMQNFLFEQVVHLKLTDYIEFKGRSLNVYEYLKEAGIFVLPSSYEGFPNALMEALSVGVPSISTNCDFGPSDLIHDGINGLLVETDNVTDLKEKINTLLHSDSKRADFRAEGPRSMKRFNYEIIMHKWESLINKTIKN